MPQKWSGFVIESAGPPYTVNNLTEIGIVARMEKKRNLMHSSMQWLQNETLQTSGKAWDTIV